MEVRKTSTPYILWADDDPDDLMVIQEVFKSISTSFIIYEVHNGSEVLQHLKMKHPIDFPCLIIMDMNMPIMDGKKALTLIKNDHAFREIPVIMFTTSNSKIDKTFCALHNVPMISKPQSYDKLKDEILKILSYCDPGK